MNDEEWKKVFKTCNKVLGEGSRTDSTSQSWCAWTTFDRLESKVHYWNSGIPKDSEITDSHIAEGVWSQPFLYKNIAHLIIPKKIYWEDISNKGFFQGEKYQDIDKLSEELKKLGIEHTTNDYWLEIKDF